MSRDTQTILARAALLQARDRAQRTLAAVRGQGSGTQQTIELRGVVEERGLGWLAPATVARTKEEYALAEQAAALAAEEETAARVALSQFEQETKRRKLARERAAIAERDAERAAGRQDARRDRARDLVARVTAQRQAGPQPSTLFGRTFRVTD